MSMGSLHCLVYYASVARGTTIVAEYTDGGAPLFAVGSGYLEKIPPFHSRFSYSSRRRIFNSLIEHPFVYCTIVDEALGKATADTFLDQVRDEFKRLLKVRGLALDGGGLVPHSLDTDFAPVFDQLVAPLVGIPQKEEDLMKEKLQGQLEAEEGPSVTSLYTGLSSHGENEQNLSGKLDKKPGGSRSLCTPFRGKRSKKDKKNVKEQEKELEEIMMENSSQAMDNGPRLDVLVEDNTPSVTVPSIQKTGSDGSKSQQIAQRMWWQNVRLVLALDAIVCVVLFGIWLGICKGINCIRS
eukprot:c26341_g1_i2 orf=346-1236(-)